MIDAPTPSQATPTVAVATPSSQPAAPSLLRAFGDVRWAFLALAVLTALALWLAWGTQKRVLSLEQELVRRQQDSQGEAAEARILAKQAQEASRESVARTTLLETRMAEVALQRNQVEELIKNLSQSRDENLVADLEASLRVATQQSALTGSADPLVTALQTADDRLKRAKQPRLEPIRRAVAKDLDHVRATRVADLGNLSIRLDEAMRLLDEVPLLNQPDALLSPRPLTQNRSGAPHASSASAPETPAPTSWHQRMLQWGQNAMQNVWSETRGLVRLSRVNRPEAMLLSPDQGFFLRENLKLRLLNARMALLSRQTATAVADLNSAQQTLPRYFDTDSRKAQLLQATLTEVIGQSKQTLVPRPDDTLAALATVNGGR